MSRRFATRTYRVLIQAGAGGVGHVAVQLAKLHGCRVITTAGRDESSAFCRDVLHADEVIDYRTQNVADRIRDLTHGRGLPVVIDTVGNILAAIANLVAGGLLRAHVSHRFALENVADGHRQVGTARTIGKVTISVRP